MNAAEIARLKEIANNACNEKWGIAGPSFIRAFDPPTVLSLLTDLEESQAALAELNKDHSITRLELSAALKSEDALRARLEAAERLAVEMRGLRWEVCESEVLRNPGLPQKARHFLNRLVDSAAIAEMEK